MKPAWRCTEQSVCPIGSDIIGFLTLSQHNTRQKTVDGRIFYKCQREPGNGKPGNRSKRETGIVVNGMERMLRYILQGVRILTCCPGKCCLVSKKEPVDYVWLEVGAWCLLINCLCTCMTRKWPEDWRMRLVFFSLQEKVSVVEFTGWGAVQRLQIPNWLMVSVQDVLELGHWNPRENLAIFKSRKKFLTWKHW